MIGGHRRGMLEVDSVGDRRSWGILNSRANRARRLAEARQPVDRARPVENAQNACASSEGWRVQWESDPPRQQSDAS